ncbi:MAG TPA: hypothetical protein VMB46_09405 [Methanomassiliicoccales archaeon]|nr:hypothetical protein [Methanomassiliicoccales archaeon]
MADEKPMQLKYAMADVLGLFVVSMFTFLVAGFGLKAYASLAIVAAVALPVAVATFIVTRVAFVNDNLLGTAIFGPLAVFFFGFFFLNSSFVSLAGLDNTAVAMLCALIGIVVLIDAFIAFMQPVRLLPILLIIAALAFFSTAALYTDLATNGLNSSYMGLMGALWLIYSLLSWYMAAAICCLVMRGKCILPLLIKK